MAGGQTGVVDRYLIFSLKAGDVLTPEQLRSVDASTLPEYPAPLTGPGVIVTVYDSGDEDESEVVVEAIMWDIVCDGLSCTCVADVCVHNPRAGAALSYINSASINLSSGSGHMSCTAAFGAA